MSFVKPEIYGAKENDTINDTEAVQNAVKSGKIVRFESGLHPVDLIIC